MKKIILFAIVIVLVFVSEITLNKKVIAEENNETPYLEALQFDESEISRGGAIAEYAYPYDSISTLINESDIIIYGKIKSWDSYMSDIINDDFIYTNYEFDIKKVLYGEVDEYKFKLREIGGIVPREEYYSKVDINSLKKDFEPDSIYEEQAKYKLISFSMDFTYDVLPLDKDFIIFCHQSPDDENLYYAIGDYHGVFVSEQGGEEFKRIMPENSIDKIGALSVGEIVKELGLLKEVK